jgi:hypothetical protein
MGAFVGRPVLTLVEGEHALKEFNAVVPDSKQPEDAAYN